MDTLENPPTYRDRRTGLIVFGIIEIIIGLFLLLFVFLMIAGMMMGNAAGARTELKMILPNLVMYPLLAAAFICLGIGSMMRRRWARALSLVVSWSWLVVGVVACVMMLVIAPVIFSGQSGTNNQVPPEALVAVMVVAGLTLGFMFIAVPLTLVLFYRSPHVKATCEAADPQRRWTDNCPLPVLAVSLWMLFGALTMPLMPLSYNSVFPFFGTLLHGAAGTIIFSLLTILWVYAAWAIYRLKRAGWWVAMISIGFLSVSYLVTFWTIDLMEMYRTMGYSEEMLKQLEQYKSLGRHFAAWGLVTAVLIAGYLLFIYRYFRNPNPMPPQFSPTPA